MTPSRGKGACAAASAFCALAAAIIGSLASWAFVDGLLGAEFILDGGKVFATTLAGAFVTAILGLAGAMKTLGRKPAPLLREL